MYQNNFSYQVRIVKKDGTVLGTALSALPRWDTDEDYDRFTLHTDDYELIFYGRLSEVQEVSVMNVLEEYNAVSD